MKTIWLALLLAPLCALAQDKHSDKETKQDIARHKQMAAAHAEAAKCLEQGTRPEQCLKTLQAACKSLAIGKYCGMKHEH